LLLLQHRGQDAAGIVTQQGRKFFMHKAKGMVRDVFRTRNMRALPGNAGLGQVRYPTAGNAFSEEEAQPFYVNAPFGIVLVHNGNLTNALSLRNELFQTDHRHTNTDSDSEVLLNVFAHELERATRGVPLQPEDVFTAVRAVHKRIKGSYAVIALIAGHGLLAFRDPHGIRPLAMGRSGWHGEVGSESWRWRVRRTLERNDPGEDHLHHARRQGACAPVCREPLGIPYRRRVREEPLRGPHLLMPGRAQKSVRQAHVWQLFKAAMCC
jgi:amidophosphoribosyltransferase